MNPKTLDILLRSAARGRAAVPALPEEAPFGFSTRLAALWRSARGRDHSGAEALWFRRALLCACAVALSCVGWSFQADSNPTGDELAMAGYNAAIDLP